MKSKHSLKAAKKPKTIKELFGSTLPVETRSTIEQRLDETPVLLTDMVRLYHETYNGLKELADEYYMAGWNCFTFERVGVELIPQMINYQIENHSPYGAYDSKMINLIVGSYMPKLLPQERNKVWFIAHTVLWDELGLSRNKLQRIAYRIEGNLLFHYKIDTEESYIEEEIFAQLGDVPTSYFKRGEFHRQNFRC